MWPVPSPFVQGRESELMREKVTLAIRNWRDEVNNARRRRAPD